MPQPDQQTPNVLVVDDEPDIRELLSLTLERMELGCDTAESLEQATDLLTSRSFDLCLTDMRLPDGNGIELVRQIQENYPDIPVAVITAYGNVDSAVEALKAGAFDFVSKPVQLEDLRALVSSALKVVRQSPHDRRSRDQLLGDSKPMRRVRGLITKLSRSQAPVYIRGESGTGKEMVARLIHEKGPRTEHPFIAVNCGAIPPELMESEFFGHKKGSFTGAVADKPGLFQAAHEGTLFLDEVAELPKTMQVKLLRAIQEKAIRPVGEQKEIGINVRILSASQVDLAKLVAEGLFRSDFYYRINVIELILPPLRERAEDIPVLADFFLKRLGDGQSAAKLTGMAYEKLKRHRFPGNVRELENILERAIALSDAEIVDAEDIDLPDSDPHNNAAMESGYFPGEERLDAYLERIEKKALADALATSNNSKTEAAKLLGLTFRAFRYKLTKYGL
ncbi:sigma-54-dependent transcriptional regulator [Pseudomonadota bacterium]